MTRLAPSPRSLPLALLVAVMALSAAACRTTPAPPTDGSVQAVAGADRIVTADPVDTVTLDGSASVAPTGATLAYAWVLTSRPLGSAATLLGADTATPAFVADWPGTYVATLTVAAGEASDSDTVTVQAICPDPTVIDRDITADATWVVFVPTCPDYLVTSRGFVFADLIIEPGTTVVFGPGAALENRRGSIQAVGTADAPITFRGTDATPGFWKGIAFSANDVRNELTHAIVDGAGAGRIGTGLDDNAVGVDGNARLRMTHTVVRNSAGVGLRIGGGVGGSLAGFASNRFESNAGVPVDLRLGDYVHYLDGDSAFAPEGAANGAPYVLVRFAGAVAAPTTWQALDVPVRFGPASPFGLVTVQAALTLAPGSVFEFADGFGINVASGGALIADGSEARITLRGVGSGAGQWVGVSVVSDASDNVFDGILIAGAGQSTFGLGGQPAAIRIQRTGSLTVRNSEIRDSAGCGIHLHPSGSLTEDANTFANVALADVCGGDDD